MDWGRLLELGAQMIQNNSDEATTNIDLGDIMNGLQSVFGENGQIDLGSLVQKAQSSGLMDVVSSWIGSGENAPIDPESVTALVDQEQIEAFAAKLGISPESAKQALADALPAVVDQATNEGPSLAEQLLDQVGGVEGAINMLKKFF